MGCPPVIGRSGTLYPRRNLTIVLGRVAAVPSFDIVSRVDVAEVDNAIAGITREIATRFDFKGSKCTIERKEGEILLLADDELKLKQLHELLKVHLTRRKVEPGALDYK